jgi:hypothetical protein
MERRQAEMFRDLARGHFVALGPAISRRPLPVRIGAVESGTRGAGPKLVPLPATPPEAARELILKAAEAEPARPAPIRRPPPAQQPDILAQLAAARPAALHGEEPAPGPEEGAEQERRMQAILAEMLADPEAAFRPAGVLYQDFLVRRRIARIGGRTPDLPAFRRLLSLARAGVTAAEGEAWQAVTARAATLPEDAQGPFLLLARAALEGGECPSDEAIARAYGSRSPGRARRLLAWLEEQGAILCRPDGQGRRSVVLLDLGCESAPGAAA